MNRPYMKSKFKVKIIGGRLVHVPDSDYVKEYRDSHMKPFANQYYPERNGRVSQMNQKQMPSYPVTYVDSRAPQSNDCSSVHRQMSNSSRGALFDPVSLDAAQLPFCVKNSIGNMLDQRVANHLQAERNKRKAQQQLYSSSLEPPPIATESNCTNKKKYEDSLNEGETESAALSKQIADCLRNTNKQKLAYALRAMKRLDLTGSGYIYTREFRDVLLMHQVFIIGGTLEKLIDRYKSNGGMVNYTRLWNFVSNSYGIVHDFALSKLPHSEETDEETTLREAKANIHKSLRAHAQEHEGTYDLTNISSSFQHCDRTRTNLMHENEMRIICKHYLPVDVKDLNVLFKNCESQHNGWINYKSFLRVLQDAQPTYFPPIRPVRRGTFIIDEEKPAVLLPDLNGERHGRMIDSGEQAHNERAEEYMESGDQLGESPRQKWYEKAELLNEKKHIDMAQKKKRMPTKRKKWEHSDPIRSLGHRKPQDFLLHHDLEDSEGYHTEN